MVGAARNVNKMAREPKLELGLGSIKIVPAFFNRAVSSFCSIKKFRLDKKI